MPEPPDEDPSPETNLLQGELRREVEAALQTLPEEQRLAVILSDLQGLDYNEISQVMKTSLGTVKSRIARGRARLREVLQPSGELSRRAITSKDVEKYHVLEPPQRPHGRRRPLSLSRR